MNQWSWLGRNFSIKCTYSKNFPFRTAAINHLTQHNSCPEIHPSESLQFQKKATATQKPRRPIFSRLYCLDFGGFVSRVIARKNLPRDCSLSAYNCTCQRDTHREMRIVVVVFSYIAERPIVLVELDRMESWPLRVGCRRWDTWRRRWIFFSLFRMRGWGGELGSNNDRGVMSEIWALFCFFFFRGK